MSTNLGVMRDLHATFDVAVGSLVRRARAEGHSVPCKSGCDACCYDVAVATGYEVDLMLEGVRRLPEAEQRIVRERTKAWLAQMEERGLDPYDAEPDVRQYAGAHVACPLLDEEAHACRIYEERPVACRGHYLIDQEPRACANREAEPAIQNIVVTPITVWHIRNQVYAETSRRVTIRIGLVPTLLAEALHLREPSPRRTAIQVEKA